MEWFCTKCYRVFCSKEGTCCGEVVPFDLQKHGRLLISLSNSWITVESYWQNDPELLEVTKQCIEEGCYSSSIIFNEFVRKLKDQIEE